MKKSCLVLVSCVAAGLSGCLGTQVRDIPDLANLTVGEVTTKLSEDIKPGPSGMEASENFRHWHHEFQYCRGCYSRDLLEGRFFNAYKPYCDAKQGAFSYQPSRKYPRGVECRSSSGNLIFVVYAKIESRSFYSLGNTVYEWFITADSFEPINPSVTVSLLDEFAEKEGRYYKRNKEQEKIDTQRRIEQARKSAEVERKTKAEEQRRKEEQIARDLPIVKTIGQKICKTVKGSQKYATTYALGNPVYGRPVERNFMVTGFTEQVSGNKIRLLVSGISFLDEQYALRSVDKIDGDVVMEPGKPIWDDAANWHPCR